MSPAAVILVVRRPLECSMKKLVAVLITSALLIPFVPSVSAKQKGHWEAVKASANRSIAVKTKTGQTHYGLIQSIGKKKHKKDELIYSI